MISKRKLDAEEVEVKNSLLILETQKTLFPAWTIERIQNEAIDEPNLYWLEPTTSFDTHNNIECHMDFPMTPRVVLFRFFEKIQNALISKNAINRKLFVFYLMYAKPQYEPWSLKRFIALKVGLLVQTEYFLNIQFKGFRGANYVLHEFTLADIPFMNPYDWISMFYIVAKDVKKYEPIYKHLKRMLKF